MPSLDKKSNKHWKMIRRLSVRQKAFLTHINRETIRQIFTTELNMWKVCTKLVSKNLTNEQKQTRVSICTEWLENWDVFDRVITGDESWIFAYDPETQQLSWEWKTPESVNVQIANESHDCQFFNCYGIILKHWVPRGKLSLLHTTSRASDCEKTAKVVGQQQLAAAPQRTSTFVDLDSAVFGKNVHHYVGTLCLFSWFNTEWLIFVQPRRKKSSRERIFSPRNSWKLHVRGP